MKEPTNRLIDATSPYLRQHAHNPVDWYPWGPEALARAKKEDKPIFLSIGYSACHWCHVMERESFEDPATAALMNELFVCIKVDREERPDLDEIYMTAVQAMTGQGGWPMSVWLTPDLEPFYGGTYFPPTDAYGRPGFPRVLSQLGKAWKDRREDCVAGSKQLTQHLRDALQASAPAGELPADLDQRLRGQSEGHFDAEHGGFGAAPQFAPKFPHASELDVLLQLGAKGDAAALRLATVTLDAMARGGIYDQLGGGFHRYSTDREWLVPHFEKMLYDNAQLAGTYLRASVITGSAEYARIGRETLDYMLREMRGAEGGFFSSQDADSEGVEGKFFVWQRDEFTALLGADAALAIEHFGVTAGGNWEHSNVLTFARSAGELAKAHALAEAAVAERLAAARARLLAARSGRVHPGTDDKILAAWCAMAIKACAEGYQVLGDERYLDAAQRAAAFVLEQMVRDGRLLRSWRAGTAQHAAYLEDHAFLADALLTLFESDFDPRWLVASRQLLATMRARFRADDGSFYFTADDHETLLARSKNVTESSTPSGQGVAARALLRAGLLLGDEALYADGLAVLRANAALLQRAPVACPSLVLAWQFQAADPREIVIAGPPADPRTRALLQAARSRASTAQVVGVVHEGNRAALEELSSVFEGKGPVRGAPALYRCRRGACEAPITDPEQLR